MAIEIGDAIWRIGADDGPLRQALGRSTQAVGAAMTAAGAAITAFTGKSIMSFADLGDELDKMAGRTGFSTNALGELKFAAEQSGASLNDIEKASKKLSTTIYEAGQGTSTYVEALQYLGLSYGDLQALSPEEQFLTTALAIADLGSAAERSALAQQVFGRAGTQLLPMLAQGREGIQAMRDEAVRLGYSLGPEASKMGATFKDTLQQMNMSLGALSMEVAQALIPDLISLMNWVKETAISFRQWRQENPGLTAAIIKATAAIGVIVGALGPLLIILPGLISGLAGLKAAVAAIGTVFAAVAAAIGAPVAAILAAIGAVIAAGVAVVYYWEETKAVLIGIWRAIAVAFEGFFAPLFLAWEKLKGMFIDSGFAPALNPDALDRYNNRTGLASGGTIAGAGWAVVGERGPELVHLPRGASVFDAEQSRSGMGFNITNHFGPGSIRSDDDIQQINRSLARVVETNLRAAGYAF